MDNNTIAAIATGLTPAGISIIRVSGEESINIVDRFFINKKNEHVLKIQRSHTLCYGFFCHNEKKIDEVLISVMKAPNSFTGEDTVEINCHGGILVTNRILNILYENGIFPAEQGEFSKRAFLNGKIDLSQAEAVMDLISSENDMAMENSLDHLQGAFSKKIKAFRENILHETAYIEASLDDPEHYSLDGYYDILSDKVELLYAGIKEIADSFNQGSIIKSGIRTAIVGKTNAGKSSILNLLSGVERSIVTDIPGTTRDTVEQSISIGNINLVLVDTAGIRNTEDYVENIGINKSILETKKADLVLYVIDSSIDIDDDDNKIVDILNNLTNDIPIIVILNKNDLDVKINTENIRNYIFLKKNNYHVIEFSAIYSSGLDMLKTYITDIFFSGEISQSSEKVIISNIRHFNLLNNSLNFLKFAKESIENGLPEDIVVIDLMEAYRELGFIIGEEIEEDLVNEIFSKFCMGK